MSSDNKLKAQNTMSAILMIIALIGAMSCRECPTESENHNNNPPDTTSHNFVWEIDTLGTGSHYLINCIQDIVAISPTDVWAVGTFETNHPYEQDSTGWWITVYNAAHWDGEKWTLKCIPFKDWKSFVYSYGEVYSVWAFNSNSVWFTNGGDLTRWNGTNFEFKANIYKWPPDPDFGRICSIWGTSDEDIYGVGYNGFCFHYTGNGRWNPIETHTDVDLLKLTGSVNPKTGAVQLWAAGYKHGYGWLFQNKDKVWHLIWNQLDSLYNAPYREYICPTSAIWCPDHRNLVVGVNKGWFDAILMKHSQKDFTDYTPLGQLRWGFPLGIHGNADNDFFIVGSPFMVVHYNGKSLKYYEEISFGKDGIYEPVSQINDYVFIGTSVTSGPMTVIRGKRVQ